MNKITLTVAMFAMLAAARAHADCPVPDSAVLIPDGNTATRDEMIAAQKAIKTFDAAVKAYADCMQQEEDAKVAAGADKAKTNAQYAKLTNAQVDKLQAIADKFNIELRAFKAKNTG